MINSAYKVIKIEDKNLFNNQKSKSKKYTVEERFKAISVQDLQDMIKKEMKKVNNEMTNVTSEITGFQNTSEDKLESILSSLDDIENSISLNSN
mmetsp:Transcript_18665/g.16531  ORF Transcript_18665/g.16531 Transcript_18665/m.16531 type:complete len:94 (+) Transcript_18665:976-1257(+)